MSEYSKSVQRCFGAIETKTCSNLIIFKLFMAF